MQDLNLFSAHICMDWLNLYVSRASALHMLTTDEELLSYTVDVLELHSYSTCTCLNVIDCLLFPLTFFLCVLVTGFKFSMVCCSISKKK